MENKDIALGILLIAVVGLAGGLGFVLIAWEPKTTPEVPTYLSGLPDEWSTAPNSSYIILNNQTENNIIITLGDILQGIATYQSSQKGGYNTGIGFTTIIDPYTNIPITGISIPDLLDYYYTYFPGDIDFISADGFGGFSTNAPEIIEKLEDAEEDLIIAIAANKQWLADSPLGAVYGNFSLVGEAMDSRVYNLEEINVLNNWTLNVYLNDELKLSLQPDNLTDASYRYSYTYSYERDDDWNLNRTYWGLNLSLICDWLGLNETADFELKTYAADGWAAPHGKPSKRGFTDSEIYHGLVWNSTYWDYVNETTNPPDGVPLPDIYDDLPILLAYELQVLDEYDLTFGETNPAWSTKRMCGLGHGPYVTIIPGRIKSNQIKWISEIRIELNP